MKPQKNNRHDSKATITMKKQVHSMQETKTKIPSVWYIDPSAEQASEPNRDLSWLAHAADIFKILFISIFPFLKTGFEYRWRQKSHSKAESRGCSLALFRRHADSFYQFPRMRYFACYSLPPPWRRLDRPVPRRFCWCSQARISCDQSDC